MAEGIGIPAKEIEAVFQNGRVINIGSGTETSVRKLAHLIADITGCDAEIIYNPRSDSGVNRMCADLSLAREKLDYEPEISLETGLRLTLERDPRFKREAAPSS